MSHLRFFISFLFLASSLSVDAIIPLDLPPFPGQRSELVGSGELRGPEDVAYDPRSNLIYTGCANGWIKLVTVNDSASSSVVRNWVKTGGRPLGIAFGHHNEVIVADPKKGLLNITQHREVKVLTVGNELHKFKLIDAVAVAKNGMIYFTEASYKYNIESYMLDIMEGQPHGRLWSYNPTSNTTRVLLHNLYFPNGLELSPDQDFLTFCETTMKRCRKYYRRGDKKGHVEHFIDLPGLPDNIRSAGKGHYLISVVMPSSDDSRDFLLESRFGPKAENSNIGGVFVVDAGGNITARYTDVELSFISSAAKVGKYIYCGSLVNLFLVRLNLIYSSM